MKYEIQQITDNYDPTILLPIWKDILPGLDERRIKWSYEENADGETRLYLLNDYDKQECVGLCAVMQRRMHLKGKEVKCGITADFAIKKEHRTLGPALKLQRAMTETDDSEILIAFPNKPSELVQRRAGFKTLGNIIKFVKVFNSKSILKKKYNPLISFAASPFVNTYLKLGMIRLNKGKLNVYSVNDKLDENFDQIWQEAKLHFDLIGNRNFRYLAWRYNQDPYMTYNIFSIADRQSDKSIAYIIYYMENNISYITDFLSENDGLYLRDLFNMFTLHCSKLKMDAVSLKMVENNKYSDFFKMLGFFKEETESKVLYFCKDENLLKNLNIFLTMGDCDIS